jgi:hypothetical protein
MTLESIILRSFFFYVGLYEYKIRIYKDIQDKDSFGGERLAKYSTYKYHVYTRNHPLPLWLRVLAARGFCPPLPHCCQNHPQPSSSTHSDYRTSFLHRALLPLPIYDTLFSVFITILLDPCNQKSQSGQRPYFPM